MFTQNSIETKSKNSNKSPTRQYQDYMTGTNFTHGMFPAKNCKTSNNGTASSKYRPNRFISSLGNDKSDANEIGLGEEQPHKTSTTQCATNKTPRGQILQYIEP